MPKKPQPDPQSCQSCRFFHFPNPAADDGFCRRLPPVIVVLQDQASTQQPLVMLDDWCGCYERLSH